MHKKNNKILISVIVPVYNEEKYISCCIKSLLKQDFDKFEVILIDDGSKDLSYKIINKFSQIRIFKTSHLGSGHARNYGAQQAKGEIMVFVDADMILKKDFLRQITYPIINNSYYGVYTIKEFVANKNNIWSKCWNINLDLPAYLRINTKEKSLGRASRAVSRNIFCGLKGFNIELGHADDRLVGIDVSKVCKADRAVCYHYNPDSLYEIFISARWIGRSPNFPFKLMNLMKYCIVNSIRNAILKIKLGSPVDFFIFKIVFDLGIFTGMILKNKNYNYSK